MIQMEIVHLLVRADIQGTDDHLLACHILSDGLVGLELFLLGGIIRFFQIQEFTAEQADAVRIVGQNLRRVSHASDVGIETDMLSVQRHIFLALQLLQQFSLPLFFLFLLLVKLQRLFIRIQNQCGSDAVDYRGSSLQFFIHRYSDQCGNIHRAGQNRCVGIGRAELCDKSEKFCLVHLNRFAGRQIFCCQNHRLVAQSVFRRGSVEHGNHPL